MMRSHPLCIFLAAAFLVMGSQVQGQALNWSWAYGIGLPLDYATDVCTVADGAVVGGRISGSPNFNGLAVPGVGVSAFAGHVDVLGNWSWVARSNHGWAETLSVDADPNGDILVGGAFRDTVFFGGTMLAKVPDTISISNNSFVARLDAAGNWLWATAFSGSCDNRLNYLSSGPSGSVLAIGTFCDSLAVGDTVLVSHGSNDVFVVKLDVNGDLLAAWSFGGTSTDVGWAVANDASGRMIICGQHNTGFGLGGTTLNGNLAGFIAQMDDDGQVLWSINMVPSGSGQAVPTDIAVLPDGRTVIAGLCSGAPVILGNDTISMAGSIWNSFLLCVDTMGTISWATSIVGAGMDQLSSLTVLGNGVLVAGQTSSNTLFVNGVGIAAAVTGFPPAALAFDSTGAVLWTLIGDGPDIGFWRDVAADTDGGVYFCGTVNGTIGLGPYTISSQRGLVAYASDLHTQVTALGTSTLQLIPVPASDHVRISGIPQGKGEVIIRALDGSLVYTGHHNGAELDVSRLPNGLYIVQVITGEEVHCARLVVAR